MKVLYLHEGQQFIWDAEKAATNRRKHGVSFESACEVFFDRFAMFVDASVPEEHRDGVIGVGDDLRTLLVVHMVREDESIRIISARTVTERERKEYEDS